MILRLKEYRERILAASQGAIRTGLAYGRDSLDYDRRMREMRQTVQIHISNQDYLSLCLRNPEYQMPESIVKKFEELIVPLEEKIRNSEGRNRSLFSEIC